MPAALVLARGLAVTGTLAAFGTLLFVVLVLPRTLARAAPGVAAGLWPPIRRLAAAELALGLLATLGWLLLQSRAMGEEAGDQAALATLLAVLRDTAFGHLVLLTLGLLGAAWVALGGGRVPLRASGAGRGGGWRRGAACLLAGVATLVQAGHSHAWSMDGPGMLVAPGLLVASVVVHLLAAGAWLGGLAPLLLVVRLAPPATAAAAARWFTPLGKACVAGIVASAALQVWGLVGGLPGLVGTDYGWTALLKSVLLLVLVGLALLNRYRLAPALRGEAPAQARRRLTASLVVQSGSGLLVVLAAALLSSLPPAIHEQPDWPFPLRPSLAVLSDPDLRREVAGGVLLLAASLVAALVAILARRAPVPAWRRVCWPAGALAAGLLWLAAPHLGLLLVDAYPTSYYASPTGFAAAAIVRGAALYGPHCAGCHGADGRGDGPLARTLPVPPADLTAAHLWEHPDGELFWWLTHGIEAPDGGMAMPGFAATLDPDERWALIDYVRAHNAGVAMRRTGRWEHPVPAPGFTADCPDGPVALSELRGRVVRLLLGGPGLPGSQPAGEGGDQVDVFIPGPPPSRGGGCGAADPALPRALAVLTGQSEAGLAGSQVLIDAQGWLRARWQPGQPGSGQPGSGQAGGQAGGWNLPGALLAEIAAIRAAPIGRAAENHAQHH